MKRFFKSILAILCSLPFILTAQNQCSKWYFGNLAGLDFISNPPLPLNNSAMNTPEGCSAISDNAGNLLFYTNGSTVWNQQHLVMANGTGLFGNGSTTQASIIAQKPGNPSTYYIFTLDAGAMPGGLSYSIVDMNLAAGMGSVTTKNVNLYTSSTEKLAGVKHCNGTDIWILSHEWNSNNFRAYLLNATGVVPTPIISSIGSFHGNSGFNERGQMKLSPNGKKLAVVMYTTTSSPPPNSIKTCELFDFDNTSGIVSNSLSLGVSNNGAAYGCEFSPDGTKLYAGIGSFSQWDLCAPSPTAILASQYILPGSVGSLQLAPDGKIYVASGSQQSISIINNPDNSGSACNFSLWSQSIGTGTCTQGLPGFISSFFRKPSVISYSHDLFSACLTASFIANPCPYSSPSPNQVSWSFGDPNSAGSNTSTVINPIHSFSSPGTYSVQAILYYNCYIDTVKLPITIAPFSPTLNAIGTLSICPGQQASLILSGAGSYSLNGAATGSLAALSPTTSAAYVVSGSNSPGGCTSSLTVYVSVSPSPTLTISGATTICSGAAASFTASGLNTYSWSNGSASPVITVTATAATSSFTVSGTDASGCSDSKVLSLQVSACLGLGHAMPDSWLSIYPNPAGRQVMVDSQLAATLLLYNETGSLVLEKNIPAGKTAIDLDSFCEGIYLLRYAGPGGTGAIKLIHTR